ncbi:TMEM175 family protein [Enterococcus hirae]|nr:TMEM175 family protein [Enterococcus hirae]
MRKLKIRLDAFSDAVIAIILTIMVLDLTPVLKNNIADYLLLGKQIGIYIISFAFVANMWYQHATLFNEIEDMSYRIMLNDFLFLIPLSLTPLATNMMAENTTNITVVFYGLLVGITGMLFRLLARSVIHFQYADTSKMRQVYQKIFGMHNHFYVALNGILIITGYFFPRIVLWFYLPYPLIYLLLSSRDRQQMYDVAQLTTDQRQEYLKLPRTEMKQFQETVQWPPNTGDQKVSHPPRSADWLRWLDLPIGSGEGTEVKNPQDLQAAREVRRAQWEEFSRQLKSRRPPNEKSSATRAVARKRARTLDLQKKTTERAAKRAEKKQHPQQKTEKKINRHAAKLFSSRRVCLDIEQIIFFDLPHAIFARSFSAPLYSMHKKRQKLQREKSQKR